MNFVQSCLFVAVPLGLLMWWGIFLAIGALLQVVL
jgi:hypothetical protein